ncbi:MAG: hypothetical protein V1802_02335 [Candidatus Aenigmatarchaeota archaeon]
MAEKLKIRDYITNKEHTVERVTRKTGLEARLEGIDCPDCDSGGPGILYNMNIRTPTNYNPPRRHVYQCDHCGKQFIFIGDSGSQKLLTTGPERKQLLPGPERKLLTAGPERKQLLPGPERKLLTAGEPWKYALPPGKTEDKGSSDWYVLAVAVHPKKAGITTPSAYTSHSYPPNKSVTIKQMPNPGSVFDHWELDNKNVGSGMSVGSGAADGTYYEIIMDQNHSITAVYKTSGHESEVSLKVVSQPFHGVKIKINDKEKNEKGEPYVTTTRELCKKGDTLLVEVLELEKTFRKGSAYIKYRFSKWDDGSTDPRRYVQVVELMTITAYFETLNLIIDSTPIDGVKVAIDKQIVGRTRYIHPAIENTTYEVEVPKSHLDGKKILWVFEKWEDGGEKGKRTVTIEDKDMKITAFYKKYDDVVHTDRPRIGSPYQGGAQGAGDTAHGLLRTSLLKGKIERDTEHAQHGKMKTKEGWVDVDNPHLRSAINKGKRILDGYAQAEFRRLFEWDFNLKYANSKIGKKGTEVVRLEGLKKNAKDAEKELKRLMRKQHGLWKGSGMNSMDMLNQVGKHESAAGGANAIDPAMLNAMKQESIILSEFIKARDDFEKNFNNDLNAASAQLKKYLEDKAETVTIGVARRWKIPLNSDDQEALKNELKGYASEIAEDFVTRGRTTAFRGLRFLKSMSRGMMTVGDVYENLLHNIINIVIGPWTVGTAIVIIQFYFVLSWIGYYPLLLLIMPAMGAVILFIINIEAVQQPFDFITHLASGAMLAYAVIIFMYSFGLTQANIGNTWFFVLGGLILFLFVGVFQIYQVGGYKSVRTLAVVVLVFGYVALGPYSGYYQIIKEQVKAPVSIAFNALKGAVGDVWLLATNPTEFYARQQMRNVRPENPLDYPKALEFMSIDALPESVPGWEEFSVITVIKNEGKDYEAKDIRVSASCNTFCEEKNVKIDKNEKFNIPTEASDRITYEGFLALSLQEERQAEVRFAKVSVNMTYLYSTDSSIFVEVMSRDEIKRRESEGKTVYRPVGAVGKSTPAQISMNVGPQPLEGNKNAILLISVLNTRPDATIRLYKGDQILLHFPSIIGTFLTEGNDDKKVDCTGKVSCEFTDDKKEDVTCTVLPDEDKAIEILQYKFQSIFFFTCKFHTAAVQDVKTGLVTASMEKFEVNVMKDKQILVTPPLGPYADADEKTCESCGKGIMPCTRSKCESMKGAKCYFIEHPMLPGECKSCANAKCENFLSDEQCGDASRVCGLPCQWDPNAKRVENNVEKIGACVSKEVVTGDNIIENVIAAAELTGFSREDTETILKLVQQESGFRHCCAVAGQRKAGSCKQVAELWKTCPETNILMSYDGSSFGVMQLNKKVHPAWYNPYSSLSECKSKYYKTPKSNQDVECGMIYSANCEAGKKTSYDVDCNIWLGVQWLKKLEGQYANGGLDYNVPGDGYQDCTGKPPKHYDGMDAALRAYNGLGCTNDIYDYVENIKNNDVGGYKNLLDKHFGSG